MFGVGPPGHHRDDQCLGVGTDAAGVALKPFRGPFGVAPVRARHVFGQRAVTRPTVAPRVCRNPAAVVEHLDRVSRCSRLHLLTEQGVRYGVKEVLDLDMIVDADAGETPLGILEVIVWQREH